MKHEHRTKTAYGKRMSPKKDKLSKGMRLAIRLFKSVSSKQGHYKVFFPNGRKKKMSWDQLHVKLKLENPSVYEKVRYKWVAKSANHKSTR